VGGGGGGGALLYYVFYYKDVIFPLFHEFQVEAVSVNSLLNDFKL